jgi:REP element-mobilizing transposase RayT
MVRRARVEVEGGLYHVYNRIASGEPVFSDPEEAAEFIELIRETKTRDGWTVLSWCVMSNHFHLVIRTATVPLWRGMHRIQNLFSRRFNKRHGRTGGVWQSRYKAKYVEDESYLGRLVLYVHLNPVAAGVADDPDEYVLCGHREVKRRLRNALVDADETLLCFGTGKKEARRSYLSAIRAGTDWGDESGRLTWHPFGTEGGDQPLESDRTSPDIDFTGRSTDLERPTLHPTVFVEAVCDLLDIDMAVVCSRGRDRQTAAVRKLMVTLGVERWRQPRTGLAKVLHKNPDVVSWWAGEGARNRINDPEYAAALDRLDQRLAARAAEMRTSERSGQTS